MTVASTCLFIAHPDHRPPTIEELALSRASLETVDPQPIPAPHFLFLRVLMPVLTAFGYAVETATHVGHRNASPGQIAQSLLDADLMIADLTGYSPQICRDIGLREMTGRPMIVVVAAGRDAASAPGFDHLRPIVYDVGNAILMDEVTRRLNRHLAAIATDPDACRPLFGLLGRPLTIGGVRLTRDDIDIVAEAGRRLARSRPNRDAGSPASARAQPFRDDVMFWPVR